MSEYVRITPSPKKGDKRVVRLRVRAGESLVVYAYKGTGRDYTFTFEVAGEVDVEEEYYNANWLRTGVLVDSFTPDKPPDAEPEFSFWERFKRWLGLTPVIPPARVIPKDTE